VTRILGINAVFHDPSAALVIDGETVACAEEERFTRRKHGKPSVPFSTWEVPGDAARWCLASAGIAPEDLDAVAYSYDPDLAPSPDDVTADGWEGLRTLFVRRAPLFLRSALPGLDPAVVRFVAHHVAHAASAYLASPYPESSVIVLDGRGEQSSYLAGRARAGHVFEPLATRSLPHSLGLTYEDLTEHLGFHRSSDEYKVMALAAYGEPRFLPEFRRSIRTTDDGRFEIDPIDWDQFAKRRTGEEWDREHADLAASVQARLEEVLLDLAAWLHDATGDDVLTMAGGVALNCVASTRLWREGPFDEIWIQPAAGDAGTALGAALHLSAASGDDVRPMPTVALGRGWSDEQVRAKLEIAKLPYERPRRGRRRCRRGERSCRVVPGSVRVRSSGARTPKPARRSSPRGQSRADERHQRPRAVPSDRPDGAGRARAGALRRTDAEPVHAVHARGTRWVGRPDPGGDARGRDRSHPDGRSRCGATGRADAPFLRGAHGRARCRQHEPQHIGPPDRR
jgi:carbamoyltransferase